MTTSKSNNLPKSPPPNTITLEGKASFDIWILGAHKISVYIKESAKQIVAITIFDSNGITIIHLLKKWL